MIENEKNINAQQRKLALYRRIAKWITIGLAVVLLLSLLVGMPLPVLILAPASVAFLIAVIAWIACFLIDRRNSSLHAADGTSWKPSDEN